MKKNIYFSPTRTQAVKGTRSVTETSDKGNATNIKTTSDKHCQTLSKVCVKNLFL